MAAQAWPTNNGAAGNDPQVISQFHQQLWGFDPIKLLETIEFPNDKFERLLKVSKNARLLAIARLPIPLNIKSINVPINTTPAAKPNPVQLRRSSLAGGVAREDAQLKEQLARSAAAIIIQSAVRGWMTRRKFVAVMYWRMSTETHGEGDFEMYPGLPSVADLSVQERLILRFRKYCRTFDMLNRLPPDFPYFAAAYIQAHWRGYIMRRSYIRFKEMTADEREGRAGIEARKEMAWRAQKAAGRFNTWEQAARKIQGAWKRFYNFKIYRFLRDLIKFRERGDPRKLLKYINPREANLIDGAMSAHVKFRLGGITFPPTIYYKIFVHKNLVDMNAFSPRDYTAPYSKQVLPRDLFDKTGKLPEYADVPTAKGGWYMRSENNGWRAVSDRVWEERQQPTTQIAGDKTTEFHHVKLMRRQEVEKKKKLKRLIWLQKMYREGKKLALESEFKVPTDENLPPPIPEALTTNPYVDPLQTDDIANQILSDLEADAETWQNADWLIRWTRALDFEQYHDGWLELATTGRSDDPSTFDLDGNGAYMLDDLIHADDKSATDMPPERNENEELPEGVTAMKGKKARPWSGRSQQSIGDVMFSSRTYDDDF
ncbi:hypothetical protein HK097_003756 [Rhizophlyctis rosea]|uniref:Uncharacterized protein n=1 Tax=Rhizophlyctis rosea TaxID=64517 RepID=A0AAD5SEI8_9FUNG|nr:hypothetical protein HK097_003756 [Rhizophlyctis rosea]